MKSNKIYFCFKVNTVHQAFKITSICQNNKIIPIFYIQFYIINGFGPDWIIEFRNLLLKKFNKSSFKLFVDCRRNYGLFINLVSHKINYIKVNGDKKLLFRLKQIAYKNKISINPKITILDITKIKNIELKIIKHLQKRKNEQYISK